MKFTHARTGKSGFRTIIDTPTKVDLLALRYAVLAKLGIAELPEGTVQEIRLILSEASIVVDGTTEKLTVPSGEETGVKVKGRLEVSEKGTTDIVLGFDAERSLVSTGHGWLLKPVIRFAAHTERPGVDETRDLFQGEEAAAAILRQDEIDQIIVGSSEMTALRTLPNLVSIGVGVDKSTKTLGIVVAIKTGSSGAGIPSFVQGVPVFVREEEPPKIANGGDNCPIAGLPPPNYACHMDRIPTPINMGRAVEAEPAANCGIPVTGGFRGCWRASSAEPFQPVFVTVKHGMKPDSGCRYEPMATNQGMLSPTRFGGCNTTAFPVATGVVGYPTAAELGVSDPCSVVFPDAALAFTNDTMTSPVIEDAGLPWHVSCFEVVGKKVQKSGHRTGQTFGEIDEVHVRYTETQPLPDSCCTSGIFKRVADRVEYRAGNHLVDLNPFGDFKIIPDPDGACPTPADDLDGSCAWSMPGDSGSAVLTRGSEPEILGLTWTTRTAISITDIESAYNGVINALRNESTPMEFTVDYRKCAP